MSIVAVAAAIAALKEKGLPAADILDVVQAIVTASASEVQAPPSRSKAAERQARYRERNKPSQIVTGDVTTPSSQVSEGFPKPLPNHPNSIPKKTPKGVQKGVSEIEKPEDVSDAIWRDFQTHRRAKKAPITETVLREYRREAGLAGVPLEEAIRISIVRNWQGFRSSWLQESQAQARGSPQRRPTPHDQIAEFERMLTGERDHDGPTIDGRAYPAGRDDRREAFPMLPGLPE